MNVALMLHFMRVFPSPEMAEKDGFLCLGGDLSPERLLAAYSLGIFPCYTENSPILWWSPDPRCVLPLEQFHLPQRSARKLKHSSFELTWDKDFSAVIRACSGERKNSSGVWLLPEMIEAYEQLHALGYAHSVETWSNGQLVGGLYGIGLGSAFFGESMFHREAEASRFALAGLVKILRLRGVTLLDCQQDTPHILRMGAIMLSGAEFRTQLRQSLLPLNHLLKPWTRQYLWSKEEHSWWEA